MTRKIKFDTCDVDLSSVFSTCVGGRLWLGLLSSWAPEVENQFLFTDPGSAGNIIPHV